jgi:hypothetical protein
MKTLAHCDKNVAQLEHELSGRLAILTWKSEGFEDTLAIGSGVHQK